MKFKPGDPVWVNCDGYRMSKGEHAATVLGTDDDGMLYCPSHGVPFYRIDVEGCPHPRGWVCCEFFLRPRRDDYQQHEPLGSRADLDKWLHHPNLEVVLETLSKEHA